MYAWIVREFSGLFVGHGFEYQQDERPVFIRRRGEVFDVVMFETINFGMHFAAYVFNWLPEMSLDGSGEFRADTTVLLNGGVFKRDGAINPWGSAFIYGNGQLAKASTTEFSRLVERYVAKSLRKTSDRNEFIRAINPDLMSVACGLPGLKKYL